MIQSAGGFKSDKGVGRGPLELYEWLLVMSLEDSKCWFLQVNWEGFDMKDRKRYDAKTSCLRACHSCHRLMLKLQLRQARG
jgi:hypothetical protein